MSKKNYIVDSKEIERLKKVNNRVNFLVNRIKKDIEELQDIKESEKWLNYLNEENMKISTEESQDLNAISQNIMYAASKRY